jgi:putative transposase
MTASAKGTSEAPGTNVRQKAGLNRSILDAGWGRFAELLTNKLGIRGGTVEKVPAA